METPEDIAIHRPCEEEEEGYDKWHEERGGTDGAEEHVEEEAGEWE